MNYSSGKSPSSTGSSLTSWTFNKKPIVFCKAPHPLWVLNSDLSLTGLLKNFTQLFRGRFSTCILKPLLGTAPVFGKSSQRKTGCMLEGFPSLLPKLCWFLSLLCSPLPDFAPHPALGFSASCKSPEYKNGCRSSSFLSFFPFQCLSFSSIPCFSSS